MLIRRILSAKALIVNVIPTGSYIPLTDLSFAKVIQEISEYFQNFLLHIQKVYRKLSIHFGLVPKMTLNWALSQWVMETKL